MDMVGGSSGSWLGPVLAAAWLALGLSGGAMADTGAADLTATTAAGQGAARLSEVGWSELTFKARKLLLSATATLRVSRLPAAADHGVRLEVPEGTALPLPETGLTVVTTATDLPFGRNELTTVWLDPASGAALQSEKLVTGSKAYWKLWRYTRRGFFRWRSEPAGGREKSLGREAWSRRDDRLMCWQEPLPEGRRVTDSYALLYLISAARLDREGSRLQCTIFSKGRCAELEFVAGEMVSAKVDFVEVAGGTELRRRGEMLLRQVTGSGRLAGTASPSSDVDLGFLGMRGELSVLLEPASGIPVLVSGRADNIGRLVVRLQRLVRAPAGEGE
jgi:hypothetical protein